MPKRYNGSKRDENLVVLCHDCHMKIERVYNKRFYRKIGHIDVRTSESYYKPGMERLEILGEKKAYEKPVVSGWKIAYNSEQIQPICPECGNPGRLANFYVGPEKKKIIHQFWCAGCRKRGEKETVVSPKVDRKEFKHLEMEFQPETLENLGNTRKNLELEQWHKLGNKIKNLRQLLLDIWKEPGLHLEVVDEFNEVIDRLDHARGELEGRFFEEYPDAADIQTFYGSEKKVIEDGS